jgi:hypothetical protein
LGRKSNTTSFQFHANYKSTNNWYGYKHFAGGKKSWPEIVDGTKSKPAKYVRDLDVEKLERRVWNEGTSVVRRPWKIMELPNVIGASDGKESRWVRVEQSAGTIHGHPITEDEFLELTRE